jgi:hypothetical protein
MDERIRANQGMKTCTRSSENAIESDNKAANRLQRRMGWSFQDGDIPGHGDHLGLVTRQLLMISGAW